MQLGTPRRAALLRALAGRDPEIASERGDWKLVSSAWPPAPASTGPPRICCSPARACAPERACSVCPEGQTCDDAAISADGQVR